MSRSRVHYALWVAVGALGLVAAVLLLDLIPDRYLTAASPWIVVAMVPACTLFPLLYLTFYRWNKTRVGGAMMTKAVGLALLMDVAVWFNFRGEDSSPYREEIQTLIFLLILAGLWYQLIVFIKIKREALREERDIRDGIPTPR